MAATRGQVWGADSARVKHASRLGSKYVETCAATWRTFVRAMVTREGVVAVTVTRDDVVVHTYTLEAE